MHFAAPRTRAPHRPSQESADDDAWLLTRLLDDSVRAGVWPDSVQVSGDRRWKAAGLPATCAFQVLLLQSLGSLVDPAAVLERPAPKLAASRKRPDDRPYPALGHVVATCRSKRAPALPKVT
jgi:hypothetical protein